MSKTLSAVRPLARLIAVLALGSVSAVASAAPVIYTQPEDVTGNILASQNDIGGLGNFFTAFDDFTLAVDSTITDVHWAGGYFNGSPEPNTNPITGFEIQFYSDSSGQPGASLLSETIAGNGGESNPHTCGGAGGGFPCFNYSVDLSSGFAATGGTKYWVSIVADIHTPPQWGVAQGSGGNGTSFSGGTFGAGPVSFDLAFDLTGIEETAVPEPATLALAGLALAGMGLARRRKQS
jgi:PEP-CTERM motif-containing protein